MILRGAAIGSLWRNVMVIVVTLIMSATTIFAQYNKDYFLWVSSRLMIQSEYQEAISSLNTLLRSDSRAYEAYFLRGVAKYNLGDLMGADSDFSLAIAYNPVYTNAYTYRAITRARLGNYDDALQDFAHAIDLRPDLSNAYYSRGVTRLLNEQYEEAIEDLDQYIRHNRREADAYINRGVCYLHLKDTTEAFTNFDTAIRTNRNSPDGYSRRGTLYLQQSRNEEAEADFNSAIALDSTHLYSLFNRAIVRNNTLRPEQALEDFDRIIAHDSTSSITLFNRAIILSQIGDYNMALEDLDRVAYLSQNNVLVYFYRGNILAQLGEVERAEVDYSRAISLYGDFANAYLNRSSVRMLMGKTKEALADRDIAERKISEHQSKLRDSSYSIYSDTTYRFDKLLSFDSKIAGSNFDSDQSIAGSQRDLELIPLYKFTLMELDSTRFHHREYYDAQLEEFIAMVGNPRLTLDYKESNISTDSLSAIARRPQRVNLSWTENFELSIVQNLVKQYTSSIESLTAASLMDYTNPYVYLNRAVTRYEMIEFISSIESSFQRISIESDPANKLKQTERKFDYDEAIADIDRAIALHPTLAYSYYNRGGLMVASEQLPEAYEAYTIAIELYPGFAEAYYNRAIVQIMMRDTRKGCIDLSKAGELGISRAYDLLERYSE